MCAGIFAGFVAVPGDLVLQKEGGWAGHLVHLLTLTLWCHCVGWEGNVVLGQYETEYSPWEESSLEHDSPPSVVAKIDWMNHRPRSHNFPFP